VAADSRYIYLVAATTMPALAVAIDALIRRWRFVAPALVALVLIPVPRSISAFNDDEDQLGPAFATEQLVLSQAATMPFARLVPPETHVLPGSGFGPSQVTIGWLLRQQRAGKLPPAPSPDPFTTNNLKLRLGLNQFAKQVPTGPCFKRSAPVDLQPAVHQVVRIDSPVFVTTLDNGHRSSLPLRFDSANGRSLVVGLTGLNLRFLPTVTPSSITICQAAR